MKTARLISNTRAITFLRASNGVPMDKGVIEGIVAGSPRGRASSPVITPSAADLGTSANCPTG
jgi:hypothetical protein